MLMASLKEEDANNIFDKKSDFHAFKSHIQKGIGAAVKAEEVPEEDEKSQNEQFSINSVNESIRNSNSGRKMQNRPNTGQVEKVKPFNIPKKQNASIISRNRRN
jgi:hypothetical protein